MVRYFLGVTVFADGLSHPNDQSTTMVVVEGVLTARNEQWKRDIARLPTF